MTDHGGEEFLNNFSTVYDLSYNHYPKCVGGPIHRKFIYRIPKHIPEDDYLPCFVSDEKQRNNCCTYIAYSG